VAGAYLFFSCKKDEAEAEAELTSLDPVESVCDLIRGFVSVVPLEPEEVDLLLDLIKLRFVITVIITSWRCVLHPHNAAYVLRWNKKALDQLQRASLIDPIRARCMFYQAAGLNSQSPFLSSSSQSLAIEVKSRREAVLPPSYRLFYENPVMLLNGFGCELIDESGKRYIDFYNNVASVGHCNPAVLNAVCSQLSTLNTHTRYLHPSVVDLSETLLKTLPRPLSHCYYTCSGSEANDLAYRLASCFTRGNARDDGALAGVICTQHAYHGGTFITSSFTPCYNLAGQSPPPHIEVLDVSLFDAQHHDISEGGALVAVLNAIKALRSRNIRPAMLILDCGLTSDGVYPVSSTLLRSIISTCKQEGVVFVADEVQVGFARTGGKSLWGFENILNRTEEEIQKGEFVPDIVTMGKPMANGFPMGCVVTRSDISTLFAEHYKYFNTFGGNPVAARACGAVLEVIARDGLSDHADKMGRYLRDRLMSLQELYSKIVVVVRGIGLLVGVELKTATHAKRMVNGLRDDGFLISTSGIKENVLKIRPPLCVQALHIDLLTQALENRLRDMCKEE